MAAGTVSKLSNMASTEKHLLMLVHRIPYPPNKGDKIRSFHQLRFLQENGWKVHLCSFVDDPYDIQFKEALRHYCETTSFFSLGWLRQKISMMWAFLTNRPLTVGAFYAPPALEYIRHTLTNYPIQAILCFSSPMAEYIFRSPLRTRNIPFQPPTKSTNSIDPILVMDLVDVDSTKWSLYAEKSPIPQRWIYNLETRRLASYEKRIVDAFDTTLLAAKKEADLLRHATQQDEKIRVLSNGVDTKYFHPKNDKHRNKPSGVCSLVFCGLMDYYPNVDAVLWFVREVLPRLQETLQNVALSIVGARPTKEVLRLGNYPGVNVVGRVDDVRLYVWDAAISVAPIRIARGIQNKVLEAMAMGKPVVATKEAFEGVDAIPGRDLIVTDAKPEAFSEGILTLWNDSQLGMEISTNARKTILGHYTWEKSLDALNTLLGASTSQSHTRSFSLPN